MHAIGGVIGGCFQLADCCSWKPAIHLLLQQLCEQALQQRQGQARWFAEPQSMPVLQQIKQG
jgi:hypothetical protein